MTRKMQAVDRGALPFPSKASPSTSGPIRLRKGRCNRMSPAPRSLFRSAVVTVVAFAALACTSVAQISNLDDSRCAADFEAQLTSILVQQREKPEVATSLSARTRSKLAYVKLGPRLFLVSSPSGTDYTFFVQSKHSVCLLRLYGRQKGFISYTNNLTYIATRQIPDCMCTE